MMTNYRAMAELLGGAWLSQETYVCAQCGGEFSKGRPDEEAEIEKDALWGDVPLDECAVVCDDCFKAMVPCH